MTLGLMGYTSTKIISQYGEKAFDQEMKRVNGWNRHRKIVDNWAHKGRGGHGRY